VIADDAKNRLYYGDNLDVLRRHVKDESVDLIYLDPPFNSNANYNVLFAERSGKQSAAQIKAFDDTWHWDVQSAQMFQALIEDGGKLSEALRGFEALLGYSDMLAYLAMMAPRLRELHRALKPTGSIYLHCDPTASHYLKVILDVLFGPKNFRNEIIWRRTNVHSDSKTWSRVSDTLLFYTKGEAFTWNPLYAPHAESHIESKYNNQEPDGRRYCLSDMTSPSPRPNMMYEWKGYASPPNGWRYQQETMAKLDAEGRIWYPDNKSKRPRLKRYLGEMKGTLLGNVWVDIFPINSQAAERLGYPTQKPVALLERILKASSNEGDVVLDPFCGCGTTIDASQRLKRKWLGIDITHLAVNLIRHRLQDTYGDEVVATYEVIGEPTTAPDAEHLAQEDPWQFQWWALGLVGARPAETKKGADKGIDGRLYFHDDVDGGKTKQIIFSVKAGKIQSAHVRDLCGVLQREKAEIGVLISFQQPSRQMITEAATAGFYESRWGKHPKIQLLTVEELLEGKKIDMPPRSGHVNVTHKKAKRQFFEAPRQLPLEGS